MMEDITMPRIEKRHYGTLLWAEFEKWNIENGYQIVENGDYYESLIPEQTFSQKRGSKLCVVESSFNNRIQGSFYCSLGWPMQFDRADTLAVEGAIQLLKATGQTEGYLTDANDASHDEGPLSTMEAVKVEMLAAYAACHAHKQELRAAINAVQTEEELNAIEITWPV